MAKIITLKDHKTNELAYPQTVSDAVYMDNGSTLEQYKESVSRQFANYPNVTVTGTVTNLPDNEDIRETEQHTLQLADRNNLEGMGYVILRKNKSFAEQVIYENTIYEVRYDFDLGNGNVTVPQKCVLKFVGGKIGNGSISGTETKLSGELVGIFDSISIGGDWDVPIISSKFFCDLSSNNAIRQVFNLSSDGHDNDITIEKEDYDYPISFSALHQAGISLRSRTSLHMNGVVRVVPNAFESYRTIYIVGKQNIEIDGCGRLIGDREQHDYSSGETHEACHGIVAYNSRNIHISGIEVCSFPGDGIALANTDGNNTFNNVHIESLRIHDCRRQGITSIQNGVTINDCEIYNIEGTAPQAGIDIEPNNSTDVCSKQKIFNNIFRNCVYGVTTVSVAGTVSSISIENNLFDGCSTAIENSGVATSSISVTNNIITSTIDGGDGINFPNALGCEVKNNVINVKHLSLYLNPNSVDGHYLIQNNIITGGGNYILSNSTVENNHFYNSEEEESDYLLVLSGERIVFKNNVLNGRFSLSANDVIFENNKVYYKTVASKYNSLVGNRIVLLNNSLISHGDAVLLDVLRINGVALDIRRNRIELGTNYTAAYGIRILSGTDEAVLEYNSFVGQFNSGTGIGNESTGRVIIEDFS